MLFKLINILKCLKKCLVNIYFLINLFIFETRNFYDVRLQFCQKSQKAVLTWCTETAKNTKMMTERFTIRGVKSKGREKT